MHATHRDEQYHLHLIRESRREDLHQADVIENSMVEVNGVKNFLKNTKTQCYL